MKGFAVLMVVLAIAVGYATTTPTTATAADT